MNENVSGCFFSEHSVGYMADEFYRSKDPTNSINVLKENAVKPQKTKKTQITHAYTHKIVYKYNIHK